MVSSGRRIRRLLVLLPLVWTATARSPLTGASTPPTEHEVKAAFLYSFAKYVQWPDGALGGQDEPFIIGVLGEDPFGRVLDETVAGKSVLGHPVALTRFVRLEDAVRAHILFVGASEEPELSRVLRTLRGRPVLSAGETDEFAERGGIVGFKTSEKKVRFDINLGRAEESRLKISSQLLKLATIVPARP
jgi:hypothetical protein